MNLDLDFSAVEAHITAGLIRRRRHPTEPYTIYNYTEKAAYSRAWTPEMRACRGLILDDDGMVVARSFDKFFNLGETPETEAANLPPGAFEVTDKLDGCFLESTPLNLWDGGTITIGEVVRKRLTPVLIGVDTSGSLVPCTVIDHFDNGTKNNWLAITLSNAISGKSGSGGHPNVLRVTPNHHIWINGDFRPAIEAQEGDTVMTYAAAPNMSVLHMVQAGLLGDGCLSPTHNGWRYQECHKETHLPYTEYVRSWLGEGQTHQINSVSGHGSLMAWATSKQYAAFAEMRQTWYPSDTKQVPQDLSWIDDFSIAKWYMDDGSLAHSNEQQDRACFATNGFDKAGVDRLASRLTCLYGVSCSVYFSKGWALRVNAGRNQEIDRFWQAIAPHVVPIMRYKLPCRYRDVPYVAYTPGSEHHVPVEAKVVSIRQIPVDLSGENNRKEFPFGRRGLDIKTTTGNYFAKGILVHNSLGILYRTRDGYAIATRGSFDGEQAVWATAYLRAHHKLTGLHYDVTLLFEIIYPANRIVLDYGARAELVLIGARRFDGYDYSYAELTATAWWWHLPIAAKVDAADAAALSELATTTKGIEGWVLRFDTGLRVKVKTADYVAIHRARFGLTPSRIHEALQTNGIDALLMAVPEEVRPEIELQARAMLASAAATKQAVEAAWEATVAGVGTADRKAFALHVVGAYPVERAYLFMLLDKRPIDAVILKNVDLKSLGMDDPIIEEV